MVIYVDIDYKLPCILMITFIANLAEYFIYSVKGSKHCTIHDDTDV